MSELKPCPFCGRDAVVIRWGLGESYQAYCAAKCCEMGYFPTQEQSIVAWNTRHDDDARSEIIATIEDAYYGQGSPLPYDNTPENKLRLLLTWLEQAQGLAEEREAKLKRYAEALRVLYAYMQKGAINATESQAVVNAIRVAEEAGGE